MQIAGHVAVQGTFVFGVAALSYSLRSKRKGEQRRNSWAPYDQARNNPDRDNWGDAPHSFRDE